MSDPRIHSLQGLCVQVMLFYSQRYGLCMTRQTVNLDEHMT